MLVMTIHLHSCWSPCFWHNNVRDGSLAVAVYSLFASVMFGAYTAYVMCGGDSSQLWLPFFETNLNKDASLIGGGSFTIAYMALLALLSVLLGVGVATDIRGMMLPWLAAFTLVPLFQATFGLWLICGYYIYLEVVFAALCIWLWMTVNIYCWLVVRSHYRNVKMFQSPDIEYLDPY